MTCMVQIWKPRRRNGFPPYIWINSSILEMGSSSFLHGAPTCCSRGSGVICSGGNPAQEESHFSNATLATRATRLHKSNLDFVLPLGSHTTQPLSNHLQFVTYLPFLFSSPCSIQQLKKGKQWQHNSTPTQILVRSSPWLPFSSLFPMTQIPNGQT